MSTYSRLLGIAGVACGLCLSEALFAADLWKGSWQLEFDRDRPFLTYFATGGKTVFRFGCGTHFELDAVYPGEAPKQDHTKASITIASGKTRMDFSGFSYAGADSFPPNTTIFNQADLGYPELDDDKWGALEDRFLDLLGAGPLTISAEGKSYTLPPVNVRRWRARFQKIC
jgi:hypothetical protein